MVGEFNSVMMMLMMTMMMLMKFIAVLCLCVCVCRLLTLHKKVASDQFNVVNHRLQPLAAHSQTRYVYDTSIYPIRSVDIYKKLS